MRPSKTHSGIWLGYPVVDFVPDKATNYGHKVYRISEQSGSPKIDEQLEEFLNGEGVEETLALVIGHYYEDPTGFIHLLCTGRRRLPNLRGFFLGDSNPYHLQLCEMTPILESHPLLEHLVIRGRDWLTIEPFRHLSLKSLVIESPDLKGEHLQALASSVIPNLEQLEIWVESASLESIRPLLSPALFPNLKKLGIIDPDSDRICALLRDCLEVESLEEIDLSPASYLSAPGMQALLDCPAILNLKRINLSRYGGYQPIGALFTQYTGVEDPSAALLQRLKALPIDVDISDLPDPGNPLICD